MEKILVSACLLGDKVRYDGGSKLSNHNKLQQWLSQGRVVSICPEVAGGLSVPRPPAEQQGSRVITQQGIDVTEAFQNGAVIARNLVEQHQIRYALLKANSPSCGNDNIYDGSFSGQLISGQGVTAKALTSCGVRVFNEHQIEQLAELLL
jgi:uncharacterized protein YbbK (DUF523 family)